MMLDYLERQRLFVREEVRAEEESEPRAYGKTRNYSFRDVVVLRAINQLLKKGVSVQRIKTAIKNFSEHDKFECDRRELRFDGARFQYLVTDGVDVYFQRNGAELVSLLTSGQNAFLFVLDVADAHEQIRKLDEPAKVFKSKTR